MTLFDEEPPVVVPTWSREFWVSDPGPFTDICFDLGITNFVFRAQFQEMPNIRADFTKFVDLFSRGRPWRVIWTPYPGDWAVLFDSVHGWKKPQAVWRIWRANRDKLSTLERLFTDELSPGTLLGHWGTFSQGSAVPVETVKGQEHRVLLANIPHHESEWAPIVTAAHLLQASAPHKTLHFHGQKSVGRTIGVAVKSFDHPVRLAWADGFPVVLLPNGMRWDTKLVATPFQKQWLQLIGIQPKDFEGLERPVLSRKVYETNLRSLRWAFLNWDRAWDFRRPVDPDDLEAAEIDWSPKRLPIRMRRTKREDPDIDRWLCDTCSLKFKCPYSREGAVCILPDSEPAQLAQQFGTRSSAQIVQALGTILGAQSERAQRAMRQEQKVIQEAEEDPDAKAKVHLSGELTKLLNTLFDRGVVLAKLVDPGIAKQMGHGPNVNLNLTATGNQSLTSQSVYGYVEAELRARGISPKDATPDLIQQILIEATPREPAAIEATSTDPTET